MKLLCGAGTVDDRSISRKSLPRLLRYLARDVGYVLAFFPANENALSAAPTRVACINLILLVAAGVPEALAAKDALEAEDRYVPERAALRFAREEDGAVGMSEYYALAGASRRRRRRLRRRRGGGGTEVCVCVAFWGPTWEVAKLTRPRPRARAALLSKASGRNVSARQAASFVVQRTGGKKAGPERFDLDKMREELGVSKQQLREAVRARARARRTAGCIMSAGRATRRRARRYRRAGCVFCCCFRPQLVAARLCVPRP
jgi:hypothetical protein